MTKQYAGVALAAVVAASAPDVAQEGPSLTLTAARFYRASQQTLVEVFCRVPLVLVSPLAASAGGQGVFRVSVTVRDTAGLALLSQSWTETVPAQMLASQGASTAEHFRFAAQPGRYTVDVMVVDSASGRVSRVQTAVSTYAGAPRASDLLLADSLRAAAEPADTVPRAGEVRKGALFLETSGRPVLTPRRASLGYYLEVYAQAPETAAVRVRVTRPDGSPVVAAMETRAPFEQGGGASHGSVDLAGLPPGDYRLVVEVDSAGGRSTRSAEFGMAGFATEAALATVAPDRAQDVFAGMPESRLDTLYAPLVYLMAGEEQGIYSGLSLEGKRSWLRWFWAKRDTDPATPENEAQVTFYTAVNRANQRFREGGAAQIPGWRTDRGRVFLRNGEPDEVLARPQAGSTAPYEVWKYTRGRARKYVFLDLTRFGHYALIWTNDRREPSRSAWQDLLGPEAVQDVEQF